MLLFFHAAVRWRWRPARFAHVRLEQHATHHPGFGGVGAALGGFEPCAQRGGLVGVSAEEESVLRVEGSQDDCAGLLVGEGEGGLGGGDFDEGFERGGAVVVGSGGFGRCLDVFEVDARGDWGGRDDYEGVDHILEFLGEAVETAVGLGGDRAELLGGIFCHGERVRRTAAANNNLLVLMMFSRSTVLRCEDFECVT